MLKKDMGSDPEHIIDGEASPQYGNLPWDVLRRLLQRDANELFSEAIQGGTMGFYLEEGYPLYFISDQLLMEFGCSYEELMSASGGDAVCLIHPSDRDKFKTRLQNSIADGNIFNGVFRSDLPKERALYMRDLGKKVKSPDGRDMMLILRSDVTEVLEDHRLLEERVALFEEKTRELEALASNIPGGVCQVAWDEGFTLLYGNKGFFALYGYTEDQLQKEHGNRLIDIVFEKDKGYVKNVIDSARKTGESNFEFEHRIVRRDGGLIWILVRGSFGDLKGSCMFNCVVIDITERKRVEDEARMSERRFKIALAQTDNSIFEYDIAQKVMIHGEHSAESYGLQHYTENVPESLLEMGVVHKNCADDFLEMYRKIIDGFPTATCTVQTRLTSGEYVWRRIFMTNIFDENGVAVQAVGTLEDVDEQVRREELLRYQSERDTLTGLLNRGTTERRISDMLNSCARGTLSAMMIIDIDAFKQVNDNYGHLFGDYVIRECGRRILKLFHDKSITGRIGGDEFMVFLGAVDSADEACSAAQSVRKVFARPFHDRCATMEGSCSIGLALCGDEHMSFEELYQRADIALYKAKERGKNKVIIYTPDMAMQGEWVPYSNTVIDG